MSIYSNFFNLGLSRKVMVNRLMIKLSFGYLP